MSPKTIQIFLPEGDRRGIRVAEITTRIVGVMRWRRGSRQPSRLGSLRWIVLHRGFHDAFHR